MRISDWSSDVCSSDLSCLRYLRPLRSLRIHLALHATFRCASPPQPCPACAVCNKNFCMSQAPVGQRSAHRPQCRHTSSSLTITRPEIGRAHVELQSLMRNSYAVFCLKKKNKKHSSTTNIQSNNTYVIPY